MFETCTAAMNAAIENYRADHAPGRKGQRATAALLALVGARCDLSPADVASQVYAGHDPFRFDSKDA